jgi:hypothetical protein
MGDKKNSHLILSPITYHPSLITVFMEPEIARRCLDCGASVRGSAVFCPQCGKTLKAGAASVSSAVESPESAALRKTEDGLNISTIGLPENAPMPAHDNVPLQDTFAPDAGRNTHQHTEVIAPRATSDDGERSKRQRVTAVAREVVDEKLSPRVEKLRQASTVMLEEASYDPSLRFVLVAVALILLSLLLLLLNYLF